jgi:hypothetical protein
LAWPVCLTLLNLIFKNMIFLKEPIYSKIDIKKKKKNIFLLKSFTWVQPLTWRTLLTNSLLRQWSIRTGPASTSSGMSPGQSIVQWIWQTGQTGENCFCPSIRRIGLQRLANG